MVIEDLPAFVTNLLIGAALTNIKIIFQNGWSTLTPAMFHTLSMKAEVTAQKINEVVDEEVAVGTQSWQASEDCLFIGPVPHSYLFNVVNAVVHHGGAGTTAAGIKAGKPTWICPFFGDQFFWGEIIYKNGKESIAYSLTHSLIHLLTHSLTHSLIH